MEINQKEQIRQRLMVYLSKYPSQNKGAQSIKGTSAGTISSVINGHWDNISDDMFRNISSQIGGESDSSGWTVIETNAYKEMEFAMRDAQEWRNVTWIVGAAGCGKSTTARIYSESGREVFVILCSEDMKKSDFIREIAHRIGVRTDGYSIRGMFDLIIRSIIQMDSPLLIFDEADKLTDVVFHYFVTLYNRLEDKCGMAFMSTDYIKRRMEMGIRYNKKGYNEIHSRIGRKFYELASTDASDVYNICVANGITGKKSISDIVNEAQEYEFDLRRVKKAIHREKRMGKC